MMALLLCRACGSMNVVVRWHRFGVASCLRAGVWPVALGEHMHARCCSCGFDWRLQR